MKPVRVSTSNGFTLVEVIVSLAILTIGLLAVGSGEINVVTMNRRSAAIVRATAAAENMIEMIRRNSDNLPAYNGLSTGNPGAGTPLTVDQRDFDDWKGQVMAVAPGAAGTVTATPAAVPGITTVVVNITWPARPLGVTLSTFVE